VQPNEAVYMKMLTKKPGLTTALAQSELDLSYKSRFEDLESPDGAFDTTCFLSNKALQLHIRADISRLLLPQPTSV
jgi:glucose-6-phosphate 1-dehydrogenase